MLNRKFLNQYPQCLKGDFISDLFSLNTAAAASLTFYIHLFFTLLLTGIQSLKAQQLIEDRSSSGDTTTTASTAALFSSEVNIFEAAATEAALAADTNETNLNSSSLLNHDDEIFNQVLPPRVVVERAHVM